MVIRCYPCIRGCAYVKIFLGVSLLILGVYMLAMTPIVLDCGELRSTCPTKFGRMLDDMSNTPNGHIVEEAAVNDYCDCLVSCINYMAVYHMNGQSSSPENCYAKSQAAGPKAAAVVGQHDHTAAEAAGYSTLPGMGNDECYSCAEASSAQDGLFLALVIMATLCGVALFVSAGCEHLELKHHNLTFALFGIASDVVCTLVLLVAVVLGWRGSTLADSACRPQAFDEWFREAGQDSTMENPDQAALFTQFFMSIFNKGLSNLCGEERTLHIYTLVCALGVLSAMWSFVATSCAALGFSNDGEDSEEDPDHHHAQELQDLLKLGQGHRMTGRRPQRG